MLPSRVVDRASPRLVACLLAAVALMFGCGSSGGGGGGEQMCTYAGGGVPDSGAFNGVCPNAGCPAGTVCVREVGGVAGGGGEYCAPIPNECHGTPSCACMGSCVCTNGFGSQPEMCSTQNSIIYCDNGIR